MKDAFKQASETVYGVYTFTEVPVEALKKGVIDNTVRGSGPRYRSTEKYFVKSPKNGRAKSSNQQAREAQNRAIRDSRIKESGYRDQRGGYKQDPRRLNHSYLSAMTESQISHTSSISHSRAVPDARRPQRRTISESYIEPYPLTESMIKGSYLDVGDPLKPPIKRSVVVEEEQTIRKAPPPDASNLRYSHMNQSHLSLYEQSKKNKILHSGIEGSIVSFNGNKSMIEQDVYHHDYYDPHGDDDRIGNRYAHKEAMSSSQMMPMKGSRTNKPVLRRRVEREVRATRERPYGLQRVQRDRRPRYEDFEEDYGEEDGFGGGFYDEDGGIRRRYIDDRSSGIYDRSHHDEYY